MKKQKNFKIITRLSLVFCSLALLVAGILIANKDNQEQIISNDLLVNTGANDSSDSVIKLKANARVESGVTKVKVEAAINGTVSGFGSWYNAELSWDLNWKTEKADNVENYVKLDVLSNTSVELTYLQQFDTQIILSATSVENDDVCATCTIDCYERSDFENYTVKVNGKDCEEVISSSQIDVGSVISGEEFMHGTRLDLVINNDDVKVGTIETVTKVSGFYTISSELLQVFEDYGYTSFKEIAFDKMREYDAFTALEYIVDSLVLVDRQTGVLLETELHDVLSDVNCWFTLMLQADDLYMGESVNQHIFEMDVLIDYVPNYGDMSSVSFDKSSIIF